ncbi:MAG: hypothetical protein NC350_02015 [Corallococcus sp.]|nr:hypothetical protein [Corallococcus sp.]
MKNKKILTLAIIVAVIVILIVVFVSVFTVKSVNLVYHSENGGEIASPVDAPVPDDILKSFKGKNIMFLSKSAVLDKINKDYPEYHALDVVRKFPSHLEVHFVKRQPVFCINSANKIFIDSFGYVMFASDNTVINIENAFVNPGAIEQQIIGSKLVFSNAENNAKMEMMLTAVSAVWQLNYAFDDIPSIIASFEFGEQMSTMTIVTSADAKIIVSKPDSNLEERLHKGFGVYYNQIKDLAKPNVEITVLPNGQVITNV